MILLSTVLLPAVAVAASLTQKPLYQGSSQVLVSRNDLANILTNTANPTSTEFDFNRIIQTEAQLATTPAVAHTVIARAHLRGEGEKRFLAQSAVVTNPNSNIITLTVTAGTPALATRLASAYASAFVAYSQTANLGVLKTAAARLTAALKLLKPGTPAYNESQSELQRIQNLQSLGNSTVSVVQTAHGAVQTQPKTARNLILGLILGLAIGIALAFIFDRLDTHVRTSDEVEQRLRLPLLGRLAAPPKEVMDHDRIVMLAEPAAPDAEAFRVLRTNILFADVDRRARTLLVTSAVAAEGKSTTVANLAVALARGGQRVVLVDLDLRQPTLERYFDLQRSPGTTNILLGEATLDEALVEIPLGEGPGVLPHYGISNGSSRNPARPRAATLHVLPTGDLPPNPGEFVTSVALRELLSALAKRTDYLLIDSPPLLQVGDAMEMSSYVDAMVLVARLGVVRRRMLDELTRLMGVSPAPALGVVVTDATAEPGAGYGYYYSYGEAKKDASASGVTSA